MSYDKGKTIKEYMQGGYAQPMEYANGGYIPGVSRALYSAGLNRKVGIAQDEQREQAKALEKQGKRRGLFSKLGSLGGTALGGIAAGALAGMTGGLSLLATPYIAKGLGSAAGAFAGEKLAGATASDEFKNVGQESSTGLLDSGFEELGDIRKEYGEGALGRAAATGIKTGLMAGGADKLQGFGDKIFANRVTKQGIADNPWLETASDADDAWAAGADYLGPEPLSDFGNRYGQSMGWDTPQTLIAGRNQGGVVRGYEDGGKVSQERYGGLLRKMVGKMGGNVEAGMYTPEGGMTREGYAKMFGATPESIDIDTLSYRNPSTYNFEVRGLSPQGEEVGNRIQSIGLSPLENLLENAMSEKLDSFKALEMSDKLLRAREQVQGYAGGGLINMLPFNRRIM